MNLEYRFREINAYNRNIFRRVLLSTMTDKLPVEWSAVHDIRCGHWKISLSYTATPVIEATR